MFKLFKSKKKKPSTKFSELFHNASSRKRKKVFLEAARKAKEDQERVMREAQIKVVV